MDYKAIYYKIIENAKKETENGNRYVGYYEKHHIQPKSLGGTNDKENLVKLTAREHFICHWLLVKMYDKGTIERNKMLCALWRMQSINESHKRYINSHVYEKLRIEFAEAVSKLTSVSQSGSGNSQFGKKWYTNRNTGESKSFKEKPIEDFWIEGRNWFNNVGKNLYNIESHEIWNFGAQRHWNRLHKDNKITHEKITYFDGYRKKYKTIGKQLYDKNIKIAHERWNMYHSGNYNKLEDMAKELNMTKNALYNIFARYIPIFLNDSKHKRYNFPSNKELINIFE